MPRLKKYTTTQMQKKLWKTFSKFIRLRDCLATTKTPEYGICFTCGRQFPIKELQAGHFISRRFKALLFDEMNVNSQCSFCNCFRGGQPEEYFVRMEQKYGRDMVNDLLKRKHEIKKWSVAELEYLVQLYENMIEDLSTS